MVAVSVKLSRNKHPDALDLHFRKYEISLAPSGKTVVHKALALVIGRPAYG